MTPVFISIGSNMDAERNVCRAAALLREAFGAVAFSPVYRNPAVGFEGEDFLNLAARFESNLDPQALVERFHAIEARCGRERGREKFSPRPLDIDLLLHGDRVFASDRLVLPRPEILEHAFVLRPLAELAPGFVHPLARRTLAELWAGFSGERGGMQRVRLDCLDA